MLDEKTFKKELVRMWDSIRGDSRYKGYCGCSGLSCNRCPLYHIGCREPMNTFKIIDAVEKWSKEHQQKKYKVSRLEYDILKHISGNTIFMYITRDEDGEIYIFGEEPRKVGNLSWYGRGSSHMGMFNELFQFVKWKDEEPVLIQDVLENCEVEDDTDKR